ncbi:bifunctional aminoglycoside phosphotransferase/ATP-binding protein [Novipirellula artificiosorum]|uniref:Zeta toxin n=1 Tax=Novipirellula artificiosorum TaxID=2528016 RepID=A0A5C6D1E0_9BACT|nr:bifunctional aminoglycoside phosphotransferase/ATP-binding protein [Novipirellula artificiosorum]TWU30548.1 hypothetical protein Poly41_66430 [Novipirellula artificiosorum]
MATLTKSPISPQQLVASLSEPETYPTGMGTSVVVHETHISWVFLIGDYAYKVKKPVKNAFLDYSTLALREQLCHKELQLDQRCAKELYLDVVPISRSAQRIQVEGNGQPIEYAVKMHRFPEDALLSERLKQGRLTGLDVRQLATDVAAFHLAAAHCANTDSWGEPDRVLRQAIDNFDALLPDLGPDQQRTVDRLLEWTLATMERNTQQFANRIEQGFIRECHGDLHLQNVIDWHGKLMPFDGIEFSEEFRWIDVLSDAAFLAMDFSASGHDHFRHAFTSAYLEQTGDYASLVLLRWYLVYRSLVRAKVATIRANQMLRASQSKRCERERLETIADSNRHLDLADRFTWPAVPTLSITHGRSGSGKTTMTERFIEREGAIRIRSDIERKRQVGMDPEQRPSRYQRELLYSEASRGATYRRLRKLSRSILRSGTSVIVDATFLRAADRQRFNQLAQQEGVGYRILDFPSELATLRQRIVDRSRSGGDASDADLSVLEMQTKMEQPLTDQERRYVVNAAVQQ